MHRIAAIPGGWNPNSPGVIFITQDPAPIVIITAADTEIQTLAALQLPPDFPEFRVISLLQLQQQLTIDTYAAEVLSKAKVIIARLLGGISYWSYGVEVLQDLATDYGVELLIMPGCDRPDADLISHSTIDVDFVHEIWQYFIEGGINNLQHALESVATKTLGYTYTPPAPQAVPKIGLYNYVGTSSSELESSLHSSTSNAKGKVGILFYRAHYLSGNTTVVKALIDKLTAQNIHVVPLFISSLKDTTIQPELLNYLADVDLILNTTSFTATRKENDADNPLLSLDVPILQVIFSGGIFEDWQNSSQGLIPRDMAMNVALPEIDGKIITRAVSFKAVQARNEKLQTDVVTYEPVGDRLDFVVALTKNWLELKLTPPQERRIAVILANYPNKDGRIANGVGLDTPASCIAILEALQQAGYDLDEIPQTGNDLIELLTQGITNDPEGRELRTVNQFLPLENYQQYFAQIPTKAQTEIKSRWGEPKTNYPNSSVTISSNPQPESASFTPLLKGGRGGSTSDSQYKSGDIPIPGQQLGNIFLGVQPSRGYDLEPSLNYHAPDLVPTHDYLAFYYWLREVFQAHAIIHVGKHGNLEWLPGKSIALSANCYPEIALGAIPNFYPFIVNDPGEGSQAKRRTQAVIIDHLTPPLTRAELYGNLLHLEGLIDEYYEAENLDPTRLNLISDRITALVKENNLDQDLGITGDIKKQFTELLNRTDSYLCELKESQIRDGLHIFGKCPEGRLLRDLIVAIARHPHPAHQGITRALAKDYGLDFDPLMAVPTDQFQIINPQIIAPELADCRHQGDVVELLEIKAAELVEQLIAETIPPLLKGGLGGDPLANTTISEQGCSIESTPLTAQDSIALNPGSLQNPIPPSPPSSSRAAMPTKGGRINSNSLVATNTSKELEWIRDSLLPNLLQTPQEITNLLRGLDGHHIPSGVAGAPTRGRPEVLPTGRNFYSVDIRALPTETAWSIGRKAAALVIDRYTQEQGEYPRTLALSVWGTATMRTGGDDIAQALALLGVQPVWDGIARRVVDFEILPLAVLGRPRVDVTLRISGFFRDAFPNLIDLFDQAVVAVSLLEEPEEMNPLAAKVRQESQFWADQGLADEEAKRRSQYRVFGSKPGAYGAGLQGLLEAQNWSTDDDLAKAFLNWSSYAYTAQVQGEATPESLVQRLRDTQIILHNQDNREHDLLDSDDYYQFQGGLAATVRSLTGKNPQLYFGDNSLAENPKVRSLTEEITRVYRSRVINPKWIAGAMRHGYKGAFEMAATVDFIFAYDVTANCVPDHMYTGVAEAYLLDPQVQEFIQNNNPWALRDMAERLLEAKQRGLWAEVSPELVDQLRAIVHQSEGAIEAK